jgi:hypothetical protein
MISITSRLKAAAYAACIHFSFSLFVAVICAAVVLGLWYPYPYRELSGGLELFLLIVSVDIVCGPLLTAVIFNPAKPRKELVRDLSFVGLIQLAALLYGLNSVMIARPVYLVFEVDRFNAIGAVDVDPAALSAAKSPWNKLPLWGVIAISVREPKNSDEMVKSIDQSIQGKEPSERPDWWQPLEAARPLIIKRAKLLVDLRKRYADKADILQKIDKAVKDSGKSEAGLRWLPLTSRHTKDWTVLVDAQTGVPLAYAAVDGF